MRLLPILLLMGSSVCLSGCAGFKFYSDSALSERTAIPIAQPRPHLLVVRTGAKDKPLEASIVYISDYENAIYAEPRSGFGSSNLSLSLANGQLTAFGQQTDTKIPELVTSLSGLITARGGAAKANAEADQILAGLQSATISPGVAAAAKSVAADITLKSGDGTLDGLTQAEKQKLAGIQIALNAAASILEDPVQVTLHPTQLNLVRAQATALGKIGPIGAGGTNRDNALQTVAAWKAQLDAATKEPSQPKPSIELYAIDFDQTGSATLRRVALPNGQ